MYALSFDMRSSLFALLAKNLFNAINALKEIEWFRKSVRDIRGYRVEEWSDFTESVKKD